MYFKDHNPQHFHARYNSDVALINIETLDVIEGKLEPKILLKVKKWALIHKAELIKDWDKCAKSELPNKIDPLK